MTSVPPSPEVATTTVLSPSVPALNVSPTLPVLPSTIALAVLVENGGQGSEVAAPIAKKALEYWLKK